MRYRVSLFLLFLMMISFMFGVVATAQAQTYTYSTLYSFKKNGKDPASPESYLTVDAAGNLYGTSNSGGAFGFGTVFKVSKTGTLTVLHSFKGAPTDGANPLANVARDAAGNLYGTTQSGGAVTNSVSCSISPGCGTIFKLTPSGTETVLYNFTGESDGESPSNIVMDAAKNIYGISQGGVNALEAGVLFELDNKSSFHVLHSFCSKSFCNDGQLPNGSLVLDSVGNVYGATLNGGKFDNAGTVYKVTPGDVETVLHNFTASDDGAWPNGVIQNSAGDLYGVTSRNGAHDGGTLFKLPEGAGPVTTLYSFCSLSGCADGETPFGRVQLDQAGNIYGIAGNNTVDGVVWELDAAGTESILFTFASGVSAVGGLTIDSGGNLYGCTVNGGPAKLGSVFKLTLAK